MKRNHFLVVAATICSLLLGCDNELYVRDEGNLVPKTVDDDPSLPSIFVNGTKLHAEAWGNPADPMVLFLHGGPGADYRSGLNVKELMNDGYYVVFYDQRGAGLSRRHPLGSYTSTQAFEDITSVIEHYRTSRSQKVFLFGHSWGGMLAAGYVNEYPNAIDGIVLVEPGGFKWEYVKEYGKKSRKLELFAESTNDVLYPDQFMTGRRYDHAVLDYKLMLGSAYAFAEGNPEGVEGPWPQWRLGAAVLQSYIDLGEKEGFDFTTNLQLYEQKVIFLYSENNVSYGREFCEREASFFPNAELVQINDTGHQMIHFQWNQVYPVVLNYLNSLK